MRARQAPTARWLALPLVLAVLAHARALRGEFQLDDFGSIVQNPAVKDLGRALRGFWPALARGGRPLTDLTFAVNHAAGGLDPWGFHATNLALHLSVVGLVFLFTRAVLRLAGTGAATGLALAVAGIFALHPMQTQAVSYVVQRAEVLASGLYLAALLLLLAAERRGRTGTGVAAWVAGLAAFALGLAAKAIVVTLPAAYLLLTAMVPGVAGRKALATWPRRVAMIAPWMALDLLFAAAAMGGVAGQSDAGFSVPGLSPWTYFLTQWRVLVTYLRLLAVPAGQSAYWVLAPSRSLAEPAVLASGFILATLVAGAGALWWTSRDGAGEGGAAGRVAAFGVAWFFVVLAPTSSVVPIADLLFEHRVYLASWGPFVAVAVGADSAVATLCSRRGLAGLLLTGAVWGGLAVALHRRNAVWETRLALWSDVVEKAPRAQRPRLSLALARWERGENDEAIRQFHLALDYGGRGSAADEAFILNNLAVALLSAERNDEAVASLGRAIALEPKNATAHANLALALLRRNDLALAEEEAERALALRPEEAGAWMVLGGVRMARGDAAGAVEPLERAVRLDPDDGARWLDLAGANEKAGRRAEACGAWRRVERLPIAAELRNAAAVRASAAGCATPSRSPR